MRRFVLAALCLGLASVPAGAFRMHGGITTASATQAIIAVTPSSGSFAGGMGSANQLVFTASATMSMGAFSGTWMISSADANNDATKFAMNSATGALTVCNTAPTCADLANNTYHINVIATQAGATGSPFVQAVTIIGQDATFIATDTFKETTGNNQAANWPLQRGLAFKYGAINPATEHVEIRVASGSTCNGTLLDYQWDEIATRTENGADGSWKHAVYTVRLPAVNANQFVTLAFCKVAGAYSPSTNSISLANLCSAHPLAMDFNNVKNQDNSMRSTGTAVWELCSYIATTGREAPIQYANGQIRKGWIIRGEPVYTSGGNKDPLLYVMAYVDVFSVAGNPNTIDRIKHVVRVANAWMQVAAGTDGVAGSTDCNGGACPVGFANDPQMVSYDAEVARRRNGRCRLRAHLLADGLRSHRSDKHGTREHIIGGLGDVGCTSRQGAIYRRWLWRVRYRRDQFQPRLRQAAS